MIKKSPNRLELMKTREEIDVARKGKEILQDKMDSLVSLFFGYVKSRRDQRRGLEDRMGEAFRKLLYLESLSGTVQVKMGASSVPEGGIVIDRHFLMGVEIPKIKWLASEKKFGFFNVPVLFDKLKEDFEKALEVSLSLGETEKGIAIVSEEIKKGRRTINSLENFIIPELEFSKRWVEFRLEQISREDRLRYKIIKKRLGIF